MMIYLDHPSIKEALLYIIKSNGSCTELVCDDCPLSAPRSIRDRSFACHVPAQRYSRAIKVYLHKYGKESLVEELI